MLKTPFHLSKIREKISKVHIFRIYWLFSRLTLTTGLGLATSINLIDKVAANSIINSLQAPIQVAYCLSVGLLLMRFTIDASLLIRHTFFPSEEAKKYDTTVFERFKYELNKRQFRFANDLVWGSVNFITNFIIVNPSHALYVYGGPITAAFLVFDLCLILCSALVEKKAYLTKKAQYTLEHAYYKNRKNCVGITNEQEQHI